MSFQKNKTVESMVKQLEFRMAVTTAMLSTLDLDYVLYVILSGITSRDGLGFNRAFLVLDDDEGRTFKVTLAVGPPSGEDAQRIWTEIERDEINFPDLLPRFEAFTNDTASQALTRQLAGLALPLNRLEALAAIERSRGSMADEGSLSAVLASCVVNRQPTHSNDVTLREEVGGSGGGIIELRNYAVVPLMVKERMIGAIVADNYYTRHPVDAEELRSLQALGNLAALAIDRAQLHSRTAAMAEIDGLTGVYNRRYYAEALERAIEAANRGGQCISIVVFDLDHFKRINDEHGHLVGDEVLKDVARLLVADTRGCDMVARYGGEEFVVLFKSTTQQAAVQVAEKLRARIKLAPLAGERVVGLTLSAGVATSCGGESAEQLFARADRALYAAKQGGRDRVVADDPDELSRDCAKPDRARP